MALPNLSQISEALDKIMPELTPVPVGTVAYAHEVPTGWLQCNGAAVSRTTYARLFKKIGTKYGAGDGSTTFNLPDLQHRVLEGTNTPSEVAQKVEAGLPDITGGFGYVVWTREVRGAHFVGATNPQSVNRNVTNEGSEYVGWVDFQASKSASIYGGSTVQPASVRLMPIIKA